MSNIVRYQGGNHAVRMYKGGGKIVAGGALQGAGTGAAIGSAFGPIGTGVGAGIGAVGGAIGGAVRNKKLQRQQKRADKRARRFLMQEEEDRSRAVLATYPTQGVTGISTFKKGGELPNMLGIEDRNLKEISDGLFLIKGDSHENGGVSVDTNADFIKDAEVEGDETVTPEGEVFSDSLNPSQEIVDKLSSETGVKLKKGMTYAGVSEALGKADVNLDDVHDNRFSRNTKDIMGDRIEEALDALFQDQEAGKTAEAIEKFKKGGKVKMYNEGGELNPYTGKRYAVRPRGRLTPTSSIDNANMEFNTMAAENNKVFGAQPNVGTEDFAGGFDLGSIAGQVANLGAGLMNAGTLDQVRTNRRPTLVDRPRFNYVDRSGAARSRNAVAVNNAIKQLRESGQPISPSTVGQLVGARIEGDNAITDMEGRREDAARANFNNNVTRVGIANAGILNNADMQEIQLHNDLLASRVDNRNAIAAGVVGNEQNRLDNEMDAMSLLLAAEAQGDTGVVGRSPILSHMLRRYGNYNING